MWASFNLVQWLRRRVWSSDTTGSPCIWIGVGFAIPRFFKAVSIVFGNFISCPANILETHELLIPNKYTSGIYMNYGCGDHSYQGCLAETFQHSCVCKASSGRFRFLVPPSGTICLSTSHLRRHSWFSDDSRPFCFPVPTKTLSYDSCVTITIHQY